MDSILSLDGRYAGSIGGNCRLWSYLARPARRSILFCILIDLEQLIDDHIVQRTEVNHAQQGETDEEAALAKATDITDPVQNVVHLTLDHLQVELNLERD